jgi:hypothetical protein
MQAPYADCTTTPEAGWPLGGAAGEPLVPTDALFRSSIVRLGAEHERPVAELLLNLDQPSRIHRSGHAAIWIAGVAALLMSGIGTDLQATTGANDCLAAPNASSPRRQHWYCRTDEEVQQLARGGVAPMQVLPHHQHRLTWR